MIVGIGSDLANIERIEEAFNKFGDKFINRLFSAFEQQEMETRKSASSQRYICSLAKRFAAKEACSKALGTGFGAGTSWKDIEVIHLSSGKPSLKLSGAALEHAKNLAGDNFNIHLTMTDDYPWAQAFVVLERL